MKKKFGYGPGGKLVRDRTMEYGLQGDSSCRFSYKYLSEQELQPHLFNKLQEEVAEVLAANNKEEICAELADVLDIIELLKKHNNISEQELAAARQHKYKLRGGFDTKLFVEWIEFDTPSESHEFYEYCLSNPEKYPKL